MHKKLLRQLPLAFGLVVAAHSAWASDEEGEFHGYARVPIARNSADGAQACFGLAGVAKYRLGNECDAYGEFWYTRQIARAANGVSFVGTIMPTISNANSESGGEKYGIVGLFIEAKNIALLNGGVAWLGKRYYNRPGINQLDLKIVISDGVGFGIDGVPMGPGKISYGLFRNDVDKNVSATRHLLNYRDLPVNRGGTLAIDATAIQADAKIPQAHDGWSLSVVHYQDKLLGGNNAAGVQYGVGPGIKFGGTGDILDGSEVTRTRIFENMVWQITRDFSGELVALVQRDKRGADTNTWTSFGIRPVYAVHENIKLQLEIGQDRIRPSSGGPIQRLTKVTLAPTLSSGRGYWARPDLRLFATYAKWNKAAQDASAAGSDLSSTGVFGGRTSGWSMGAHLETWF